MNEGKNIEQSHKAQATSLWGESRIEERKE